MSNNISPPHPDIRNAVTHIFKSLQPHAQSAALHSRAGSQIAIFELPKDVKVMRNHFQSIMNNQKSSHCWVEWTKIGLRLCVKLKASKKKRKHTGISKVEQDVKKQKRDS